MLNEEKYILVTSLARVGCYFDCRLILEITSADSQIALPTADGGSETKIELKARLLAIASLWHILWDFCSEFIQRHFVGMPSAANYCNRNEDIRFCITSIYVGVKHLNCCIYSIFQ